MGHEKLTIEKNKPLGLLGKKKKEQKAYFDNGFCIYGSEIYTLKILLYTHCFCYDSDKKLSQIEAWKVLESMYKQQPQIFRRQSFIQDHTSLGYQSRLILDYSREA